MVSRPTTPSLIVAYMLFLSLSACGSEQLGDETSLPLGSPVGLSELPVLSVGERPNDPDHELYEIVTPFLLPEGLGVPLSADGVIRVFDQDGELVRTLGAPGQGPGEFMALGAAWARADTIEALDTELNRVTRFIPNEEPQTIRLEGIASAQSGVPGLATGGWILYGVKAVQRSGRDRIAVHQFAADGSHVAELGEVEGFRRHVHDGGGGPDPISPRPVVRTDGDRVYWSETLTPRIREFDVMVGETRVIGWEPTNRLSSQEAIALAANEVAALGRSRPNQAWTEAGFDALTGSEDVSVFWDFLVDGEGFIWVRDYDPRVHAAAVGGLAKTGSGGEWAVLDHDGNRVTSVVVPSDFEPLRIEDDHLIGVRRDSLDVESVRVYRIERTGS